MPLHSFLHTAVFAVFTSKIHSCKSESREQTEISIHCFVCVGFIAAVSNTKHQHRQTCPTDKVKQNVYIYSKISASNLFWQAKTFISQRNVRMISAQSTQQKVQRKILILEALPELLGKEAHKMLLP